MSRQAGWCRRAPSKPDPAPTPHISPPSRQRSAASKSSCATTARRSTGTASSPRSSPNTSRGWRSRFPAGATGSASSRRSASRAPRAAFRCSRTCWSSKTTAARPSSGWPTSRWPDELRAEMADFILRHKEFPAALQKIDGRAALSRGRQGRRRVRPVHPGADGQGFGQSEDHAALLSGPLGVASTAPPICR